MTSHTLRFLNPQLQGQFEERLQGAGLASRMSGDGTFDCTDDDWTKIVSVAHQVRDSCFRWYFSWCDSPEDTKEREGYLRTNGLRFEMEDHGDHLVFLLPWEDEDKHCPPNDPCDFENCSFCDKLLVDVKRFYTSKHAAICDECIERMGVDLRDRPLARKG